ncbi:Co2+/Mg2+ efflux protein ApaG [Flavobacteriaceae bacterium]|nr:Co2+/Mg2+ efflux protein ApaG [Flavobacteriaceae bacterium]MDB2632403.1 Co2+/Mg2+ efflux protein ApaG [Flavobacteriaceae bacterium]
MVHQITNGIKVSVETHFEGAFYDKEVIQYAFSYIVKIKNEREDPVQLLSRTWHICDALNSKEKVEGDGVVGAQPIIQPNASYIYNSGCTLKSPFGAMKGNYTMLNISDNETFKVQIPSFKLCTDFAQN